jgi:hypothetical protein
MRYINSRISLLVNLRENSTLNLDLYLFSTPIFMRFILDVILEQIFFFRIFLYDFAKYFIHQKSRPESVVSTLCDL